jgi:hypothetical protein
MQEKDFTSGDRLVVMWVGIFCALLITSCGIYVVSNALNPPYAQERDANNYLEFSGDNPESYFAGYVLWYKSIYDEDFQVCEYNGTISLPTISKSVNPITITVYFEELFHQDLGKNFKEILDDPGYSEYNFQFAVSSYGENGEESEKVLF